MTNMQRGSTMIAQPELSPACTRKGREGLAAAAAGKATSPRGFGGKSNR